MATKTRGSPSGPIDSEKTTINFAAGTLASHTATTVTVALSGVVTTDIVHVVPVSALPTGAAVQSAARVTAAGVIEINFVNSTPANITGGSPTMYALKHKFTT